MIDISTLRRVVSCNSSTGELFWKERPPEFFKNPKRAGGTNTRCAGKRIENKTFNDGYLRVRIMGRSYMAHRVVWAITYGSWPDHEIDHINNIRTDNRVLNLRAATRSQNGRNLSPRKTGTSKYKGVSYKSGCSLWVAQLKLNRSLIYVKYFKDEVAAAQAYDEQAIKHFGEYAKLNFPRKL